MPYIGRYNRFINALKGQDIAGSIEIHHIIPKSMGGTNDSSNLIALTPRQHYLAHWMLWKAYAGAMAHAFFMMNHDSKYKRIGSKGYDKLRSEAKINMRDKRIKYMSNPEARDNLRKHRAKQVIPAEAYIKQAKIISSLVWLNDGVRSYRVRPELVAEKLSFGLKHGRLMNHMSEELKMRHRQNTALHWAKVKSAGYKNLQGAPVCP